MESYDTDGVVDIAGVPKRLTVPTGVTKVRVEASVYVQNVGGNPAILRIHKNATPTRVGNSGWGTPGYTANGIYCSTGIITVSSGDYFICNLLCTDGSMDIAVDGTFFAMEIIE